VGEEPEKAGFLIPKGSVYEEDFLRLDRRGPVRDEDGMVDTDAVVLRVATLDTDDPFDEAIEILLTLPFQFFLPLLDFFCLDDVDGERRRLRFLLLLLLLLLL